MKQKYVYIAEQDWFENSALSNPILFNDHKLRKLYPQFYRADYDLKLCVTKPPIKAEKSFFLYNDYKEQYGSHDIGVLRRAAESSTAQKIFLNGFRQEHLEYLAPYIQDSVELLYLFKCNSIKDLSVLSTFPKLKCVLIFWNNKLETLWDVQQNANLAVLSFLYTTKLRNVDSLRKAHVAYITFDSSDNCGNRKPCLLECPDIFQELHNLKHLKLIYKNQFIDY